MKNLNLTPAINNAQTLTRAQMKNVMGGVAALPSGSYKCCYPEGCSVCVDVPSGHHASCDSTDSHGHSGTLTAC